MQLLVTPVNYKNAIDLISLNTPIIAIGTKKFCERTNCYFSIKEIKKIISIKKNTKIYILINRIFFEKQISNLEKYLLDIVSLNKIDGIIFSDYSVPQILFEHKIKINLCYNPETLVTNYCQFNFFKKNNINNVFLSRELNKKQVFDICSKKQKMKIFIQASGYAFMMQSRWQLLTNFKKNKEIKEKLTSKKLYLKEEKRKQPFIIYEDENGTSVLTGYNLCLIDKLNELFNKVDVIIVDSFLHDEKWTINVAKIFLKAIELLKKDTYSSKCAKDFFNKINLISDEYISHGFFEGKKEDLIYLENNQDEK